MYVSAGILRGQKMALDLLELELKVVSHLIWVLGIEPRSSVRAASTLNH